MSEMLVFLERILSKIIGKKFINKRAEMFERQALIRSFEVSVQLSSSLFYLNPIRLGLCQFGTPCHKEKKY